MAWPKGNTYNRRHGLTNSPTWNSWRAMRNRPDRNYSDRGITVCERWLVFENFLADMGFRPSLLHTLDRQNNDLGYFPGNCHWALKEQQDNNKRTNVFIEFGGERLTIVQWARKLGINRITLHDRIRRQHWPLEKALCPKSFKGNNDHNREHVTV